MRVSETVATAAPPTIDSRLREVRRVAIVPALNEEHTIGRVIEELRAFDPGLDVVAVDDGSPDRTSPVAAAKGAPVLRLPPTRAIGGGRSAITALRSIYYMVKVLLAIFVGLFRRDVVPREGSE